MEAFGAKQTSSNSGTVRQLPEPGTQLNWPGDQLKSWLPVRAGRPAVGRANGSGFRPTGFAPLNCHVEPDPSRRDGPASGRNSQSGTASAGSQVMLS